MKKFILGIIFGIMLVCTVALATTYTAEDASFKIFVEGKEFTDGNAVVINGSTYLPLRALGNILSVPVNWNDELHQVEIGNQAPVADKNEYSRNNPAPIGTVQTYTKSSDWWEEDNYTVSIRVLEVVRGDEIKKHRKDVITDDKPDSGFEFMLVKIAFSVVDTKGDFSIDANKYSFTPFTSNNEETEQAYLDMSVNDEFNWLSGQLYKGGNTEGWIVIQVKKDDPAPKLAYGLDYNGANGIWFALN